METVRCVIEKKVGMETLGAASASEIGIVAGYCWRLKQIVHRFYSFHIFVSNIMSPYILIRMIKVRF